MPTTTSITTSYSGEKASNFIAASLLSAPTLDKGGVTVKPSIKYKEVMQKLAMGDIIADASCNFTATSSVTLTERYLEPKEFQVNLELCKKDFHSDWLSIEQGFSAHDELPGSFADFLVSRVAAKVASKTEVNIYQGADANAGEFDGFQALLAADADVVDVVADIAGLSASNIIAELGKVLDAIPNTLYGNDGLSIYISQKAARAYVRAQAALGYKDLYHVGQTQMDFEGVKLFVANGIGDDVMIAAEKENLFFGTGLESDMNEVKLIDLADIDGSMNVRVILRFTAAVNFAIGSEIVLYS